MADQEQPSTKVGVLDKAMAILRACSRGSVALLPSEIAAYTDLPLPTVYRLAQALTEHGMLEKDGQRFRLGMTLMHLGMLVAESIDLRTVCMPQLRWLNELTNENAELQVRYGETRICIALVRSTQNLRPFVDVGAPLALHAGAGAKVLLAWLPPAESEALAVASAARFATENPLDVPVLHAELARIRKQGWAASDGERAKGVAGIAAPIFDAEAAIAGALVLAAPSSRLTPSQRQEFVPLVCQAAARTSRDLGYRAPETRDVAALADAAS